MSDPTLILACNDLVVRSLRALDERDYPALAAAFAEDGVWERGGEHLVGPDAVHAAVLKRPADLQTQHLVSNLTVDAEGADAAVVRYLLSAYAQRGAEPFHLHAIFKATDRLVRVQGQWRFAYRSVAPAFVAAA